MRQTFSFKLRTILIGLLALGLSLPVIAATDTSANTAPAHSKNRAHQKAAATKTQAKKHNKHSRKHASRKVSRYGKQQTNVAHRGRGSAERQRLASLSVLSRRTGPAEIFQAANAQSSLFLESRAAVVMNAETGELLYSKNPNQPVPIASITKLMTAMVVLDARLPMDELITITDDDIDTLRHSSSRLAVGTVMTRREIMLLALMSSENRAAAALARTFPGGTQAAIAAMNNKALALGMTNTTFLDSTGLHRENSASPNDLVHMVKAARNYAEIQKDTTTVEHTAYIRGRPTLYRNSDALVKSDQWNIEVSKTGFINEAGKCLVMQARINATPVVIVLMDSTGHYTRFGDANRVKQWLESALNMRTATSNTNPM
jgi:D-alanyl-D-alanine endopeptidase (penicillin-binding protein 7)